MEHSFTRAVFKESTPGDANDLGVEMDLGLRLELKNRFGLHLDYGLLLPLDGMDMARALQVAKKLRWRSGCSAPS